ncbi:hypothetical protein P43SY_002220 [Pythium insidiosum]|uniref:Protein kinase domain-containing protein n=1 Tax=Pythium insidiosum TaxID=114742 RepID=A0AAD5MAU4_PYTIN|nr:hypothetical protein P43SY_002220 [Pythium insidiosum]
MEGRGGGGGGRGGGRGGKKAKAKAKAAAAAAVAAVNTPTSPKKKVAILKKPSDAQDPPTKKAVPTVAAASAQASKGDAGVSHGSAPTTQQKRKRTKKKKGNHAVALVTVPMATTTAATPKPALATPAAKATAPAVVSQLEPVLGALSAPTPSDLGTPSQENESTALRQSRKRHRLLDELEDAIREEKKRVRAFDQELLGLLQGKTLSGKDLEECVAIVRDKQDANPSGLTDGQEDKKKESRSRSRRLDADVKWISTSPSAGRSTVSSERSAMDVSALLNPADDCEQDAQIHVTVDEVEITPIQRRLGEAGLAARSLMLMLTDLPADATHQRDTALTEHHGAERVHSDNAERAPSAATRDLGSPLLTCTTRLASLHMSPLAQKITHATWTANNDCPMDMREAASSMSSAAMSELDMYKHEEGDRPVERSPRGRYIRFDIRLGTGAYKTVYKAYDTDQGIDVAWNAIDIGVLPASEKTRIIQEVQLLQKLEHKNIINFYGSWFSKEKNQVVFITEIMTSGTLKSYIKRVQFVKWKIIKRWCIQILEGLHYLHSQNPPVIHRDLKCDNIFINGNTGDLRIGDLGLSTQLAVHKRSRAQSVLGTPEFMAPELYDESYDEKVDIYAFGMCVLEMVTKEVPYSECINPAQIYKKVTAGIRPRGLQRIVSQAARDFIELCLSRGNGEIDVSAEYLLDHPFLKAHEDDGEMIQVLPDDELEHTVQRGSDIQPPAARPQSAPRKRGKRYEFKATKDPENEHSILLNLRIAIDGKSKEIKFPFHLFTDSPHEVASTVLDAIRHVLAGSLPSIIMSHIPAWTARQWRPFARDLVARFPSAEDDGQGLRVDAVLAQLYGHRWLEVMPQDVAEEAAAIAAKMRIHSLEERGDRVEALAAQCEFRVVKLLLALAEAPTRAAVVPAAEDEDHEGRRRVEERLRAKRSRARAAAQRSGEEAAPAAVEENDAAEVIAMEKELLQIAWQDDWWAESPTPELDEEEEEDDDLMLSDVEKDDGGAARAGGIAERVLADAREDDVAAPLEAAPDVEMEDGGATDLADDDDDQDEDEEEERAFLLRWYSAAESPPLPEGGAASVEAEPAPAPCHERFRLETPSTLLGAMMSQSTAADRRVIHERVLVHAAMHALRGVATPFFEFRCGAVDLFAGELSSARVSVASLVTRHLAVAHLSPLAVTRAMSRIASMASDLSFLQSLASFLGHASEPTASAVAQGVAQELQLFVLDAQRAVTALESRMLAPAPTWEELDDKRSSRGVCATLLSALTELRTPMARVAWLRRSMELCFARFERRRRADIARSELSAVVLSELVRLLEQASFERPESSSDAMAASASSSSSLRVLRDPFTILLHVFTSALAPYLEALDATVFRRSHAEHIPMHSELFFAEDATTAGIASPLRSPWKARSEASFEDAVASVLPFRVEVSAVPTFLAPLVDTLRHALVSRQMWNRFLSGSSGAVAQRASLQEDSRLASDCIDALLDKGSSSEPGAAMVPFARVLEQLVLTPISNKCRAITGTIAALFRDQLQLREHVDVLRRFVLMQEQDVFARLSRHLVDQLQRDPIGWADTEAINAVFQHTIQLLRDDGALPTALRDIAERVSIRVDATKLEAHGVSRQIDVNVLACLRFTLAVSSTHPLRVLLSPTILQRYTRLATVLLQVKATETALTKFKQGLRHRICFQAVESRLREQLVQVADMFHFVRCLMSYFADQMMGAHWAQLQRVLETSDSIWEINDAHEQCLETMALHLFTTDKRAPVLRQVLLNCNAILQYVSLVDAFVRTVESSLDRFGVRRRPARAQESEKDRRERESAFHEELRRLREQLQRPLETYNRNVQILYVVLEQMTKTGGMQHIRELVLHLNYNGHRASASFSSLASSSSMPPLFARPL